MFTQQSQGRRPQSNFTPAQKQIIQDALAKLPKNVRGGSNGFNQQSRTQQQQTSSQGQFNNFQQNRPQQQKTPSLGGRIWRGQKSKIRLYKGEA